MKEISPTGFFVFGAASVVMAIAKPTLVESWSWWRVLLPIGAFLGFNLMYIVVGFIYLTFARIPERPDGDEAAILAPHEFNTHHTVSMVFLLYLRTIRCDG